MSMAPGSCSSGSEPGSGVGSGERRREKCGASSARLLSAWPPPTSRGPPAEPWHQLLPPCPRKGYGGAEPETPELTPWAEV